MPDPVAIMSRVNSNIAEQKRRDVMGNAELPGLQPTEPLSPGDILDAPSILGKAMATLALTYEPIRRTTQASRETVLWAGGFVPRSTFRQRASLAWSGKAVMSSRDFWHLTVSQRQWQNMERTPLIPGWMPAITNPEQTFLQRLKKGQVSYGDLATLGAEVFADPFSWLALTPEGAGTRLLSKAGLEGAALARTAEIGGAVLNPPWYISKRVLGRAFSAGARGPLSFANLLRQPEDVIPKIYPHLSLANEAMGESLEADLKAGQAISKLAKFKRNDPRKSLIARYHLGIIDELPKELQPLADQYGDLLRNRLSAAAAIPGQATQLSLFEQAPGRQVLKHLAPRRLLGNNIPVDIEQSWRLENLGIVTIGPTVEQVAASAPEALAKMRKLPAQLFDIETISRDILYAANKKQHLAPALLRFAPKVGQVGEDPLTKELGPAARRYVTDLINNYTGNGRGRKQISWDYSVLEFWQKLATTPVYRRVAGMFEKLGYGHVDDMPDFSPTTKLGGLLTHSIAVNALGGRLKSAIVNSTQVANFALVRGIPSTFKGMLHQVFQMGETGGALKEARASAGLLRAYHDLWKEDIWLKGWGARWSDVLMAPFNVAENLIRGTGFNVGMDVYAKNIGKEISQLAPHELDNAIKFARFESQNGAFVYGTLGRPPALANPLLRPFTSLLSYPFKQGEFLRRTFVNDGSAFLRFLGLHGFLIEKANEWGGASAEQFLGWGFTPMTRGFGGAMSFLEAPPTRALRSSIQGLIALGDHDFKTAEARFKELGETLPLMAKIPFPWLAVTEITGSPTGRQGLLDMWRTEQQKLGDGVVPITHQEVITNWLVGRSTTQVVRSNLRTRTARAMRKIDYQLDQRAKRYVRSAHDHDGDALAKAAWDLVQPIEIEGKQFYPDPQQVESRVQNRLKQAYVSRDVLAMQDNKFLQRVYLWSYLSLLDRTRKAH